MSTTLTTDLLKLTRKQNPTGSDVLHLKDPVTQKDHYVLVSDILTGQSYDSWVPTTEYDESDRVTFGFKLFESLQDNNTGNVPSGGITDVWWKEVSESSKPDSLERTISQTAHGFAVGNVLTLDNTGSFIKVTLPVTAVRIALVSEVIDTNNFKCVLGGYVTGLSGLLPGLKYYGQSDGTISTSPTEMLVLIADSESSGYLISSAGASSLYGNFVGLHDASTGIPTSGTGPGGSIKKGDYWLISVAGTIAGIDGEDTLSQYDTLHAKQDNANAPGHFYGLQGNVDQATESSSGIASLQNQAGAEDAATNATVGSIDHAKIITGRSLRWFWEKLKTLPQSFTSSFKAKQIAGDFSTLADGATISWDANVIGNTAQVTLGGNRTLAAITNPVTGAIYILRVVQDGTGGRTLTFNAAYTFPNGSAATLFTSASAVTLFVFFYDGTNFRSIINTGAQRFKHLGTSFGTLTDGATISWDANSTGNTAQVTLGGNRTLAAITNPQTGAFYILRVVQDGTGGRTLTFNAAYTFPAYVNNVINTTANGVTTLLFFYDGTAMRFVANTGAGKLNIGGNSDFETLTDASDVYRFSMFSRLGALFKSSGLHWDETLGQLRFSGNTAIIRPGDDVVSGNFGVKIIEGVEDGFQVFDDNGDYIRFGTDSDGRRKIFTSVPIKRLRGTNYLEDGFISEQVEASSTTTFRTIPTETDSITTVSIEAISIQNEDKKYIIGRAIFNFKNTSGVVTDISLNALCYDEQYSNIKVAPGYVTNTDTRIQCTISGTNVLVQFINTEAKIAFVQCDIDYTVTPLPIP